MPYNFHTFNELRDAAKALCHFSHVREYLTQRFQSVKDGTDEYQENWNGLEWYYHLSVDPRDFA